MLLSDENFKLIFQEARTAGCRSSDEARRYIEQKRKREADENARSAEKNPQAGPSSQGGVNGPKFCESVGKDSNSRTTGHANSTSAVELLSESVSLLYLFSNFSFVRREQAACSNFSMSQRFVSKLQVFSPYALHLCYWFFKFIKNHVLGSSLVLKMVSDI